MGARNVKLHSLGMGKTTTASFTITHQSTRYLTRLLSTHWMGWRDTKCHSIGALGSGDMARSSGESHATVARVSSRRIRRGSGKKGTRVARCLESVTCMWSAIDTRFTKPLDASIKRLLLEGCHLYIGWSRFDQCSSATLERGRCNSGEILDEGLVLASIIRLNLNFVFSFRIQVFHLRGWSHGE